MIIPRLALMLIALLVLVATAADALDNKRSGFIIGAGLGWGSAKVELETTGAEPDLSSTSTSGGLATDFRIGHGFSENWLLYYTNQQVFFEAVDDNFAQGLTGVGTMYFFSPQAPSFLLEAAVGVGVLWNADKRTSFSGTGFLLGFGYEFSRHFQIKADWYYTDTGTEQAFEYEASRKLSTFRITLNWLGY